MQEALAECWHLNVKDFMIEMLLHNQSDRDAKQSLVKIIDSESPMLIQLKEPEWFRKLSGINLSYTESN